MYKFVSLIPRREDRSRAFFRNHYETRHAPLAVAHLEHFRFHKYARNHLVAMLEGAEPGFDVISEFWYESQADLATVGAFLSSPASQAIHEDEDRFMILSQVVFSQVREYLLVGEPSGFEAGPLAELVIGLRRKPTVDAAAFLANTRAAAEALGAPSDISHVILHEVSGNAEMPWDAFIHVRSLTLGADIHVPRELLQDAAEYFVATTERCESALP